MDIRPAQMAAISNVGQIKLEIKLLVHVNAFLAMKIAGEIA